MKARRVQHPIYTASHDPQSRSREVCCGQSSRSQNRSLEGRGGEEKCVENVSHDLPWRLKETLHARRLGAVEGAPITAPKVPFILPFHRYIDI